MWNRAVNFCLILQMFKRIVSRSCTTEASMVKKSCLKQVVIIHLTIHTVECVVMSGILHRKFSHLSSSFYINRIVSRNAYWGSRSLFCNKTYFPKSRTSKLCCDMLCDMFSTGTQNFLMDVAILLELLCAVDVKMTKVQSHIHCY